MGRLFAIQRAVIMIGPHSAQGIAVLLSDQDPLFGGSVAVGINDWVELDWRPSATSSLNDFGTYQPLTFQDREMVPSCVDVDAGFVGEFGYPAAR